MGLGQDIRSMQEPEKMSDSALSSSKGKLFCLISISAMTDQKVDVVSQVAIRPIISLYAPLYRLPTSLRRGVRASDGPSKVPVEEGCPTSRGGPLYLQ